MADPRISVLMSVYNGEKYLKEAVNSILNQTFNDFEFIIIDDGSIDRSNLIIRSYDDPRIRLIENEKNIGLTKSLNKGIHHCRGGWQHLRESHDQGRPAQCQARDRKGTE